VKTADPIGRFRDHSYPVRQGIFNRGNISDSQQSINLFFILTKNALFSIKNRLFTQKPALIFSTNYISSGAIYAQRNRKSGIYS
jgi:hypothetical protein